jgi:hypothetical protein
VFLVEEVDEGTWIVDLGWSSLAVVDWFEELVSLDGWDWGMKVRLNTFELGLDLLFGVQGNVRYS